MTHSDYDKQLENSVAFQLLAQGVEYMKKGVDDIKKSIDKLNKDMHDGFVTKEQFERLKEDVEGLKSTKEWAVRLILGAIIIAVLAYIGLGR